MDKINLFWFRRDLRLIDNHGLHEALQSNAKVLCLFIFDKNILEELPPNDARVTFIHRELERVKSELNTHGGDLTIRHGNPIEVWQSLLNEYQVSTVYTNHDYEPYAKARDNEVESLLNSNGVNFYTYKDQVIYEREEIQKKAGGIYTVFTPYKRTWLAKFEEEYKAFLQSSALQSKYPSEDCMANLLQVPKPEKMLSLKDIGFVESDIPIPNKTPTQKTIKTYSVNRDFPAIKAGTSRLGIHFRFGTVSLRKKAIKAFHLSEIYLSELIWRDFYAQILANHPQVIGNAYKPQYDGIEWINDKEEFEKWKAGMTGYPLVDAGIRELNQTGHMHNRVRMVVASFLTKHLLIDWRWGEGYFAEKLLDFDLASNNGGWQWAAGTGTDAAPYFRIFNPESQMKRFDAKLEYVHKWVPEYGTDQYPDPIVDHKMARERCLATYKKALSEG
ncbi:MAG: deoxyribodipyrimidine photo-lyase [Saprospiraceae bacterium]|jgi:deoxyribodipyrimidine photo-lyase